MERGTIVLSRFPFTDLSSTKRRPSAFVCEDTSKGEGVLPYLACEIYIYI